MPKPIPVLIVSDAPSSSTGLGRITREITMRADANLKDVCRVATLGYGGPGSRKFNWMQYSIEGMKDWVLPTLPDVWKDWAGDEPGVILAIWDASRLEWFARPHVESVFELSPFLKAFLTTGLFKRWIYCPLDASGPHDGLSYPYTKSLLGFDRILAYGEWAKGVILKSLGEEPAAGRDLDAIPHGIDTSVFTPRNRTNARLNFFKMTEAMPVIKGPRTAILEDEPLVGTIATNQMRKDWALWAKACSIFLSRHPKARFWIHTDRLEGNWSIPSLLVDFGLLNRTVISLGIIDDNRMANAYSACDLTLGIGSGEGFGFPIFESLFCGTPCIHGNYGGAPEHMDELLLVNPARLDDGSLAFKEDGLYCCSRPVFNPKDWADRMDAVLQKDRPVIRRPSHLEWDYVWPQFEKWFRKGLASLNETDIALLGKSLPKRETQANEGKQIQ